jgi:hypothetical protein
MERIQSNEYFDAVQAYFVDHKEPYRVYKFLLDTLREDEYKLPDEMFYQHVDMLETTEDCMRFCIGTECFLVLCSQPEK